MFVLFFQVRLSCFEDVSLLGQAPFPWAVALGFPSLYSAGFFLSWRRLGKDVRKPKPDEVRCFPCLIFLFFRRCWFSYGLLRVLTKHPSFVDDAARHFGWLMLCN